MTIDNTTILASRVQMSDRERLVSFLEEVMNWPGFDHEGSTADFWNWRYLRMPGPEPIGYAAWHGEEVASHASIAPTRLMVGGEPVSAGQLGDLYTHPDHRGNGLADRLLDLVERQAAADGIEMMFAFPSEAGGKILSKRGYRELSIGFDRYSIITDPATFFDQASLGRLKRTAYKAMMAIKAPARSPVPGMVREVTEIPEDVDQMTERFEAHFDITHRHDRRYLQWRYADPEGGRFRTLLAKVDDRTAGLAVLRPYIVDGVGYMDLADMMADLDRPEAAQGLVAEAIRIATEEGITQVQSWIPSDHPLVPFLLRAGFIQRMPMANERKLRMICHPGEAGTLADWALRRSSLKAHIMLGDTDWI